MPDIINLLPDSVANQIAAGEVIQRPASAVKELLENSLDAKSTDIKLILKDVGKTLIQIIDNGIGMSETDARMCFERHATSKIKKADDLYLITTMGFRGEAMASIAGIAQVEMKTKRQEDQVGTQIEIEGSTLKSQTQCACQKGTSISVKNIFFNVPARRSFLKSDSVELRHIIDEFQRIAISYPEIAFSMHHNNSELFHLESGTLRHRLLGIFGENYNQRLVPVQEDTTIVNVSGFIGKPEFARKTRGEQFFFVNNRYIKSPYLNHAVQNAYEQLLPKDAFPSYFIFLQVNPKTIDVNIHPTKTEIKFEDERAIYTIVRAAIKQSLGKYNISPSLDFDQEMSISIQTDKSPEEILLNPPKITINKNYNPFEVEERKNKPSNNTTKTEPFSYLQKKEDFLSDWEKSKDVKNSPQQEAQQSFPIEEKKSNSTSAYQLHNQFILAPIKTGMIVIAQQAAHERILYENYLEILEKQKGVSQQQLFPQTLEFSVSDTAIIKELLKDLHGLGFEINEFGKNSFIIHGIPAELFNQDVQKLLEKLIEEYKQTEGNKTEVNKIKGDIIAKTMARNLSIKSGAPLSNEEMTHIVDSLFACKMPYITPFGQPTLVTISMEELNKKLKK